MKVYWYWPFLRNEELVLAQGLLRPGDRLTVHTTPRPAEPIVSPVAACTVAATLPALRDRSEGSVAWLASRATTYTRRAAARARAVRGGAYDVGHVYYLNPFTDGLSLGRLRRHVPLVSSVHDVVPHMRRVPGSVERKLLALEYRNAGLLVTHHDSVRRRLLAEFDVDPDRVVTIPLPITEEDSTRHAPDRVPVVLFFGTFRRNKGVAELLAAIESTRGQLDARFVFAGRGFSDIEAIVRDAAASDARIEAEIGYATAERKRELYRECDLVVLPYTSFASQSAVLQDAYAHHRALLVSDVGALGETVRADRTGWVVPPGDVAALAGALEAAVRDRDARAAASEAAAAVARARTPEIVGAALRAVYERAIGG